MQKLFEAAMGGGADLVKEMKKSHGGKTKHELPENVAEVNGKEKVCNKFKTVFEELYNSADTTDEVNMITSEVEIDIKAEFSAEVLKITGQVVKADAATMKNNKSDV